ncbi:MAG: hypothetical protein SF052_20190 [Bacteroidia bacterium]|nr:hypothetical protein [Bacteroidia bacterium]
MKKVYSLLPFALALFFAAKPVETSRACGFDPDDYFYGYSFFDPALSRQPEYSALFLSFDRFYDYNWNSNEYRQNYNVIEWQDFHQNKPTFEDISYVVYKASDDDLIATKKYVDGKAKNLPDSLQKNSLVAYWKQKNMTSPICYLVYAKQCEPHVNWDPYAWEEETQPRDEAQMEKLIGAGIEQYDAAKNPFIKMRFGYQVVRLAHYLGKYEECIRFHDEMVEPLKDQEKSEIYYWSLGHKAGSLLAQEKNAEAAYLYSKVFDHSPSKRVPAWLSFHIEDDAQWEAVMNLCQNKEEKANLLFMRAIDFNSRAVDEMAALYTIDPSSPKLNVLLAREVNKLEYDFFGWDFDFEFPLKQEYAGVSKENATSYLQNLTKFVEKINSEKKVNAPQLWRMAEGYLAFMNSNFDRADQIFAVEGRNAKDARTQQYARLFRWVISVSRLKTINLATEEKLYAEWEQITFDPDSHELKEKSQRFLLNTFSRLYNQQNEPGKAFLSTKDVYWLQTQPNEAVVDNLLQWTKELETRSPNALERHLLSKLSVDHPREFLQMMKATFHIQRQELDEAGSLIKSIPVKVRENIPYFYIPSDPFKAHTKDCLDCEEDLEKGPYNKLTFIEKLISLEKEAASNPAKAAENYLLLGNGYYNITFFGHAWQATTYYRSGGAWYGFGQTEDDPYYQDQSHLFVDMVTPEEYYGKAIEAAEASGNRELAAQATFMAAKCEQNRFYLAGYTDYDHLDQKPAYRKRFDQLISSYSQTNYYKEVLEECTYLNYYVWLKGN